MGMNDMNSLSHTRWNCKYHIVFAPKYRRKVFYKEKRTAIGKILRQLCEWKGVKIIEAEACPNHIHLYVEIPPKISVSHFMGYLKGKSSTMLYEQFGELKYKYRNREFWCRGYYVDTVGKNEKRIEEYVRNELKEDELGEQIKMPLNGPFTGSKKRKPTQLADHTYALTRSRRTEGYARIVTTTGYAGGCVHFTKEEKSFLTSNRPAGARLQAGRLVVIWG